MVRICLLLSCWLIYSHSNAQEKKFVFRQPKMGSIFTIQVYTIDSIAAAKTAQKAFAAVDSLNLIFSDYLETSELSTLSTTARTHTWVKVSPALFDILQQSKTAWQKSNGAFDVTVGALSRLWRTTRKKKSLPAESLLQNALNSVGSEHLLLDVKHQTIQLSASQTILDLGGIGKGYAAQRMLEIMQQAGFERALCDAAGNMAIGNAPPQRAGWLIGVSQPNQANKLMDKFLTLKNVAVSTSGDLFQYVDIDGKRYSHIVNPRTGMGLTNRRQVTVISADATQADWLSTACCILSPRKALRLAKREKADILILEILAQQVKYWQSKGWEKWLN